EPVVEFGIEENVAFDVGGQMRTSRLINLAGNALLRRQALADEIASCVAERGDEHELVFVTGGHFAEWIIEQNRAGLRRHELIRFLKDLTQHEIEIDVGLEGQTALVPLEESLELRRFQRMKLNHRPNPTEL